MLTCPLKEKAVLVIQWKETRRNSYSCYRGLLVIQWKERRRNSQACYACLAKKARSFPIARLIIRGRRRQSAVFQSVNDRKFALGTLHCGSVSGVSLYQCVTHTGSCPCVTHTGSCQECQCVTHKESFHCHPHRMFEFINKLCYLTYLVK